MAFYQSLSGIQFNSTGDPVHFVKNPAGINRDQQKRVIEVITGLNEIRDQLVDNPEIKTRIQQYELACMQHL